MCIYIIQVLKHVYEACVGCVTIIYSYISFNFVFMRIKIENVGVWKLINFGCWNKKAEDQN